MAPPDFPDRADSLKTGFYLVRGGQHRFRAGSYSGYNVRREMLCRLALGVGCQTVWADPEKYTGSPFYELINFADNEGCIGPETCAKLYKDFVNHKAGIFEKLSASPEYDEQDQNFREMYSDFERAFKLGMDDGAVQFS